MKALVIFSIAVSILFLLQMFVCILTGMKKGHVKALFGLGANLIAASVAILTARVIAVYGGTALSHRLTERMVSSYRNKGGADFLTGDGMTEIIRSISNTMVAVAVFFSLYLLLYFLIKIPRNMVYNRYGIHWDQSAASDNGTRSSQAPHGKSKFSGALICALSGILSAVLFIMPFTAVLSSVEKGLKGSQNSYALKLEQNLSPILKSPLHIAASHSGAISLFDFLTSVSYKDRRVILTDECSDIMFIALASSAYTTDRNLSEKESDELLTDISKRLGESEFMPQIASDFIDGITTSFSQNQKFLGISPLLPGGHFKAVFQDLYAALAKTNADTIRKDIPSILEIGATLYHAASSDGDNSNSLLTVLFTDRTLADFMGQLYANEDLRNLIPKFVIAGVETACDKLGLHSGSYKVLDQLSDSLTMDDITKEAALLSNLIQTFNEIEDTNKTISLATMNTSQCSRLSVILKDSKNSIFLKEIIPNIMGDLLKDSMKTIPETLISDLNVKPVNENTKLLHDFYALHKRNAKDPVVFLKIVKNLAIIYSIDPDSLIK